jgi:hypothetical protein
MVSVGLDQYVSGLWTWREIDRQTDNGDLEKGRYIASFAVSDSAECCFIRLTQTGKNQVGRDQLVIEAFEVFGTLIE